MFPYHPKHWETRGAAFWKIGYPELAAGDFYKSSILAAEAQRHDTPLGAMAFLSVRRFLNMKKNAGVDQTPGPILPAKIYELVLQYEVDALAGLCRVLELTWDWRALHIVTREASQKYPQARVFGRWVQEQAEGLKQLAKKLESKPDNTDIRQGPSGDLEAGRMGRLHMRAYPWTTGLLQRDSEAFQSIKDDCATSENYEAVPSPSLTKLALSESQLISNLYGAVAKQDIARGTVILSELSSLFACTTQNRCPTCNSPLTEDSHNLPCCATPFCRRECAERAANSYHPAICGRDFSFLESAAEDSDRTDQTTQWPLFLLRILASLFGRASTQSLPHPLKHPSMSRYVANYASPSHLSFDFASHIVNPFRMLQVLGVDPFFDLGYDTWVLETIRHRLYVNSMPAEDSDGQLMIVLHPRYSIFNHSCEPNVRTKDDGALLELTARKDIKKGEELFVSYIGEEIHRVGKKQRQEGMKAWVDEGGCKCTLCERQQ